MDTQLQIADVLMCAPQIVGWEKPIPGDDHGWIHDCIGPSKHVGLPIHGVKLLDCSGKHLVDIENMLE